MSADDPAIRARLRALPAVDRLAVDIRHGGWSEAEAVAVARAVLEQRRAELLAGADDAADLVARGDARLRPTLRRVLNGTGVIVHTNLGRAPLADAAARAVAEAARGSANVELDLADGRRGSRHDHVAGLLRELTGAEDAIAVNNGAGAALLAVAALAGGGRAIVSRGELVEIGGGFRVPEVLAQAGARMVEVGTTNRTRLADYERALAATRDAHPARDADAPRAARDGARAAIVRVHQSNFRTVGFVEQVAIEPLCGLGVPVIDDVGSGALAADLPALADEPPVRRSIAAGAALVCFSGDKLLGGPQAGLIAGRAEAVAACRAHPLARALRIGRLPLAALAATLALYRDPDRARREIPVLAMLDAAPSRLRARAERLLRDLDPARAELVEAAARVGGGALPLLELSGPAVALGAPGDDPAALRPRAARARSAAAGADRRRPRAGRPAHARRRRARRCRAGARRRARAGLSHRSRRPEQPRAPA